MKQLSVNDIKIAKPDLEIDDGLTKTKKIANWLVEWIKYSLERGYVELGDMIPSKYDLAQYLNVSSATVQNSIHQVCDYGYLISKQSIGTIICDIYSKDIKNQDDLYKISYNEYKIKKYFIDEDIPLNEPIAPISVIADILEISQNTLRYALSNFEEKGYFKKNIIRQKRYQWVYIKKLTLTKEETEIFSKNDNPTLSNQLVEKLQKYIERKYKTGRKIPPNSSFANMFNVSIKTINDAMKVLNAKKVILARRGRYGTIYIGAQNEQIEKSDEKKPKIPQNYEYAWKKALDRLKKYLVERQKIGNKLPPIRKLAKVLAANPNTARRAVRELYIRGYLVSKRGKKGGIFVLELPRLENDSYKWIALNPDVLSFDK